MEKQLPVAGDIPRVVVEVYGDLSLNGWERPEVSAECPSSDDLLLEDRQGEACLRCRGACTVRVPFGASLQVTRAEGHASFKSLEGDLEIERVGGHLSLRSVGVVRVKRVDGHLSAKNIGGELSLGRVSGNAFVRDVQGDFTVESIDGNLQLEEIDGSATVRVHGNARLNLDPLPGQRITCEVDGNLVCRLPQDASAQVAVERAASLRVKLPGQEAKNISAPYQLSLGGGGAEVRLKAVGNVVISQLLPEIGFETGVGAGAGFDEIAASIGQQVELQLESQLEMLDQQMEDLSAMLATAGLPPDQADQIERRARETSERAAARAREKSRRAQERMQRKLESASRKAAMKAQAAERASRDRRRRPEPVEAAPPGAAPVSLEERLAVLRMLEKQQITPEQADQLLAALEGRGG